MDEWMDCPSVAAGCWLPGCLSVSVWLSGCCPHWLVCLLPCLIAHVVCLSRCTVDGCFDGRMEWPG